MNHAILTFIFQLKEFLASKDQRVQMVLRILAAVFGGYGVTYTALAALALLLPLPRVDVVFFSALFPVILWLGVLLWAFSAPTAQRAWRHMLSIMILCGILAVVIKKMQ